MAKRIFKSADIVKLTLNGKTFELKKDSFPEITKEGDTTETERTQNGDSLIVKQTKVPASIKGLTLVVDANEYNTLVEWKRGCILIAVSIITANGEAIDSNMILVGDALVFKTENNTVDIELESEYLQIVSA